MASIDGYLTKIENFTDDMRSEAEDAADKLEGFVQRTFTTWIDFVSTEGPDIPSAQRIDMSSELPSLTTPTLNYNLDGLDPNQYKQAVYVSDFFAYLTPKLMADIESGGTGISDDVQDALFNNMRERDLQTLHDGLDAVDSAFGRRGFPTITDMQTSARSTEVGKYRDTRDNRNREVTALIAERAQQNIQQAIQSGISVEKANMDFSAGFTRVFLDIGNQVLQKFQIENEARVAEFDGQLKAILANLQVEEINERISMANAELRVKKFEIESSHAIEKTKALIDQGQEVARQRLAAATGLVDFYKSLVSSSLDQVTAIVKEDISAT